MPTQRGAFATAEQVRCLAPGSNQIEPLFSVAYQILEPVTRRARARFQCRRQGRGVRRDDTRLGCPAVSPRALDYMRDKGGVWFARLDQICGHVQQLIVAGRWTPRVET